MKIDQKTIWLILAAVVVMVLIGLMTLQSGLIDRSSDPVFLERVEVLEATSTPVAEDGWWDEMPTPVSLN